MRRLYATVIVLVLAGWSLSGQSSLPCAQNCQLAKSQPFSVVYDWAPTAANPDMADGFRLYRNGVLVSDVGNAALTNGAVAFGFPNGIATAGAYTFAVSAYTTTGGESVGNSISLTILKGKPAKPGNGRLQ